MKVRIRFQSHRRTRVESQDATPSVWVPTSDTFLSTLIGCAKEQSEQPPEQEQTPASPEADLAAELAADLAACEALAEEIAARQSAAAEKEPVLPEPQANAEIPAATPLICSWTWQQALSVASVGATIPVAFQEESALEEVPAPEPEPAPAFEEALAAESETAPPVIAQEDLVSACSASVLEVSDELPPPAVEEPVTAASEVAVPAAIGREAEAVPEQAPAVQEYKGPLVMPSRPKSPEAPAPGALLRAWRWLNGKHSLSSRRQLRVAETVSLGEKRFVAVVHVEGQKFLIGGGASGVSLLTSLGSVTDAREAVPFAAAEGDLA